MTGARALRESVDSWHSSSPNPPGGAITHSHVRVGNASPESAAPCNVLKPLRDKENSLEWPAYDCSGREQMCEQLWLEFASTELAVKFKDAFEDARVLTNAVQEITSSCQAC